MLCCPNIHHLFIHRFKFYGDIKTSPLYRRQIQMNERQIKMTISCTGILFPYTRVIYSWASYQLIPVGHQWGPILSFLLKKIWCSTHKCKTPWSISTQRTDNSAIWIWSCSQIRDAKGGNLVFKKGHLMMFQIA